MIWKPTEIFDLEDFEQIRKFCYQLLKWAHLYIHLIWLESYDGSVTKTTYSKFSCYSKGQQTASSLLPVSRKYYWNTAIHSCTCCLWLLSWYSSCNRQYVAWKAESICYVKLKKKKSDDLVSIASITIKKQLAFSLMCSCELNCIYFYWKYFLSFILLKAICHYWKRQISNSKFQTLSNSPLSMTM